MQLQIYISRLGCHEQKRAILVMIVRIIRHHGRLLPVVETQLQFLHLVAEKDLSLLRKLNSQHRSKYSSYKVLLEIHTEFYYKEIYKYTEKILLFSKNKFKRRYYSL